jgi:hypothetical protein
LASVFQPHAVVALGCAAGAATGHPCSTPGVNRAVR